MSSKKSGFRIIFDVLAEKGLGSMNSVGFSFPGGDRFYRFMLKKSINVESGDINPPYSFIYIPGKKLSFDALLKALTNLENYGIIFSICSDFDAEYIQRALLFYGYLCNVYKYETIKGNFVLRLDFIRRADEVKHFRAVRENS